MKVATGLDRLLESSGRLQGRRYGLLAHAASVTGELRPAHLALAGCGSPPALLLAPEHGYHGVEQDMVAAREQREPWTNLPIASLYGDDESSLYPDPEVFSDLDLLVIDLQDVGSRYYTYAASAVWAAEVALAADCEVWVLDRPNPLGGERIEGNLPRPGLESFVSAFRIPVRHGLTLGELVRLEARRRGWQGAFEIWPLEGWQRRMLWGDTGLSFIAPSPNMPTEATALIYPGLCLVEATEISEGRGTTRPFHLIGAPGIDAMALVAELEARDLPGIGFLPAFFRPQFQKHAGEICAGVELASGDASRLSPFCLGVHVLDALEKVASDVFSWREAPYEFVIDRPAIDLLAGDPRCRLAIESGSGLEEWIASWSEDEEAFREECEEVWLYT